MMTTLYIPPESIPTTDTRVPGARAYCYTNAGGSPAAIAYTAGAKKNSAWHVCFHSTVRRAEYIQNWFNNLAANSAAQCRKEHRQ